VVIIHVSMYGPNRMVSGYLVPGTDTTTVSTLRILVPVKRVIGYAIHFTLSYQFSLYRRSNSTIWPA